MHTGYVGQALWLNRSTEGMLVNVVILAAAISGVVSFAVVAVSYYLTKQKEREADWNKVKLEYYREYISAVAGIVEGRATAETHVRYTDAFNTIALVASPAVLDAVRAYQEEISINNTARSNQRHDEIYSDLINALRLDLAPCHLRSIEARSFHMITPPPDMRLNVQTTK
jgi:hypothetical protein